MAHLCENNSKMERVENKNLKIKQQILIFPPDLVFLSSKSSFYYLFGLEEVFFFSEKSEKK